MYKYCEKLANFTIEKVKNRNKIGIIEGIISLFVNFFIFIVKLLAGLFINSISLIADAFHSLSDSLSSIVIIIGFYFSEKPADDEHPFGHAKSENIASLIVAILLFIISFEFLKDSLIKIFKPHYVKFNLWIFIVVLLTIIIKEALSKYSFVLAEKIESKAIEADAFHHKTDVYATALVLVSMIFSHFGFNRVDGICGVIISLYIGYIAYEMLKESIHPLIGYKPPKEIIEEVEKLALSVDGVEGVHDIIIHDYGDKKIISLHIEVEDSLNPCEIHDIADTVEKKIGRKYNGTCVVHQDPINTSHPEYNNVKSIIDELAQKHSFHYHDLKLIGTEKKFNVIFDINFKTGEKNKKNIIKTIESELKNRIQRIDAVIVKIEPEYVY